MRVLPAMALVVLLAPAQVALAQDGPLHDAIASAARSAAVATPVGDAQSPAPRRVAFEYSDAYRTRARIHKYASVATLPLFATEFALGQSLYNNPSEGKKGAHVVVGSGIVGLYGVQAVTGVWNLVESRKDPNPDGRKRRLVHAVLMLASGAGFAITPAFAPGERDRLELRAGSASTHRAIAFTSIGIGTTGYLLMLLGGK